MPSKDVSLRRSLGLTVGALGVVFGDIGTSPLYAMRETAVAVGGHAASQTAVYGALSLIFWTLVIVVTVKYVGFIMRADNNGEGGVMALAALAHRSPVPRAAKTAIGVAALMGLALLRRRHADAGHLGTVGNGRPGRLRSLQALDPA